MTIAYLGLGTNLGDRLANIERALVLIEDHPAILPVSTSSYYETEPVLPEGLPPEQRRQEWFINAVTAIQAEMEPAELLDVCLDIERELGRVRDEQSRWAARVIDIDILLYGSEIITLEKPELTIPHPHMHERAFVLVPMLELCPDLNHPVLNKSISKLHLDLEEPEEVQLYGLRSE